MSAFSLPFTRPAAAEQAPAAAAPMAVPLGVESMFSQILEAVQKSVGATCPVQREAMLMCCLEP